MMHPNYGVGEVTALIEPRKIDVLFADRVRRLIHSQPQIEPGETVSSPPS